MPSWVNLDHQLPLALRTDAANIAIEVWRVVGGEPVVHLDSWWHVAHCTYLPNEDGSPAVIIINCVEGEPDQPMQSTRYMVDLTRRRVKDKYDDSYTPIPPATIDAVNRIVTWVRGIPERKAAAAHAEKKRKLDAEERRLREELERQRAYDAAVEAYHERLADFLASQPTPSKRAKFEHKKEEHDEPTKKTVSHCQKCTKSLAHCNQCKRLSCPQTGCPGQGGDLFLSCMAESHQNETYCSACREEAAGTLALLVAACPVCQKSFCRSNLRVCEGQEAGDAPAHAPLILCCEKCYQADRKLKKPITFCCVETACPSKEYNKTPSGVCGECAGQFGRRCGDHPWEWWCESNKCAETKLETCPTCDKALCPTIRLQSCDQCNLLPSCKRCVRAQGKQRGKGEKAKTGSGGILSTSEVKTEETANIPKNDSKHHGLQKDEPASIPKEERLSNRSNPRPKDSVIVHHRFECNCARGFSLCDRHVNNEDYGQCEGGSRHTSCETRSCSVCREECESCYAQYCEDCYSSSTNCTRCGHTLNMENYMEEMDYFDDVDEDPMGSYLF